MFYLINHILSLQDDIIIWSMFFLIFLFLIYINDLPNSLQYSSARMFADDTTLTASGKSISELQDTINHDLANVKQWLSANLIKTEYSIY